MPRLDLQTHGQCTDDMDTQPPLLYMDDKLADQAIRQQVLEEVSEDDDSEPQVRNRHLVLILCSYVSFL